MHSRAPAAPAQRTRVPSLSRHHKQVSKISVSHSDRCASCRASNEAPSTSASPAKEAAAKETPGKVIVGTEGRMTYKPESYKSLIRDATEAVAKGAEAGFPCMEVEFPAIAGLDSYKGASDLYIDTNTQFAIQAGRELFARTNKKTVVLVPDGPELKRSSELFKTALESCEGVTMSSLFEGREPLKLGFQTLFGMERTEEAPAAAREADFHVVINISTNELDDVRKYLAEVAKPDSHLVFWNCELDTLRADLGLFGFPAKSVQYDFLSTCKPAFYIRQRDYSKTVNVAPYIINYSGALFREFPGPWQVMLRQDSGEYACIAEDSSRYTLGEVKEALLDAMGLNTEVAGSTMQFLRKGYKSTVWWEEDVDLEKSDAWRT